MKKRYLLLCTAVAVALIFVTAGFFVLPFVIKSVGERKLTDFLHRETTLGRVSVNPFRLSVTISGLRVADPQRQTSTAAFDELHVNIDGLSSIFRQAVILEEIRLVRPEVHLIRHADGTYNISDLIPVQKPPETAPSKPVQFSLNNILIEDGGIIYSDTPNRTDHVIRSLNLSIPFLSNIDYYLKEYVEPAFSASINGKSVKATGQTRPFADSRETSLTISLQDIDVAHYLEYVPLKLNFSLPSALFDADLDIHFLMHPDRPPELSITGNAALKHVALDDPQKRKLLRLDALRVGIASIKPLVRFVHLEQITLVNPEVICRRDNRGQINLINLAVLENDGSTGQKKSENAPQEPHKRFELLIDALNVEQGAVTFIDSQPVRPVRLVVAPLALQVKNFSTQQGNSAKLNLAFTVNGQSQLTANGDFGIDPLSAQLAVDLRQLAIRPFEPYFADFLKIDVTGGSVFAKGTLSLSVDPEDAPLLRIAADASINNFAAIDRVKSHDFLKFRQLALHDLSAGNKPVFLKIGKIGLEQFFAKIVINEDGSTNLQDIFDDHTTTREKEPLATETQAAEPDTGIEETAATPDIQIGQIRFSGGTVDFADHHIQPNYAVTMLNLSGGLTGLSSQNIARAPVDLKGNLGMGSPVDISGTINPLAKDLFVDMQINFTDIEMSAFSPYTGKYLGYPITKGKLNLGVHYLIDQRKLRAENKIYFDQLTFGEKTGSPDAISAPVTTAVSLLTDRHGRINLDVPLSGSLDDPDFRILPLLWQVLTNLITRAVTSPFSLLSSLSGGAELSFLEFEPGRSRLSSDGEKKIETLAKALYDRPKLKLDIEAYVDPDLDRKSLKTIEFERLLKAQKLKEMIDRGQAAVLLDDLSMTPEDYEKYLTLAYKAAKFSKPRNMIGLLKDLPATEMEKLLRDHISITDSDLATLAASRARTVHEALLQAADIEPARIFLIKPNTLAPSEKPSITSSRVEFKLK